jgi:pimeloyl-ACP methyl ester carboxylesterase
LASLTTASGLPLHYEDECFAPPWTSPDVLVLINGAETSLMWWGWMPLVAASLRVVRPDMRGYGRSGIPPAGSGLGWSLPELAGDVLDLLDHLEVPVCHLVGSKFGSAVTLHLAAEHPKRVRTLTLLSPLVKGVPTFVTKVKQMERGDWVVESNRRRYGSEVPVEEMAWWNELMAGCDERVIREQIEASTHVDLFWVLPQLQPPTLLVTTDRNQKYPVETVVEWQRLIPRAELVVLPSDGYNVAALKPQECARETLSFIARHAGSPEAR